MSWYRGYYEIPKAIWWFVCGLAGFGLGFVWGVL